MRIALRVPLVAQTLTEHDRVYLTGRVAQGLLEDEQEVGVFEERFADRVGCEWAVAVTSGTAALIVAFRALELGDVAVPSWSCVALRNAVNAHMLAGPVLLDVSWDVRRARAIMRGCVVGAGLVVAHMFGRDTLLGVRPDVEDYTLSLGADFVLDAPLGVCSTHQSKMISTGRGGVIFGDDPDLHDRVVELVHYERHTAFGYSVAMSSMQAALGVSQLAQLDSFIERRRELAARYTEAFRAVGIDCPDADSGSVFFRYLISVDDPAGKVVALSGFGVEAGRGVYPPLHQLANLPDTEFPGTMAAVDSLLSVPVHPSITDEQAEHIIEAVLEVCAP